MKVVFLDRDGVINSYPGDKKYVTSWKKFRFLPRAKEAIARLSKEKSQIFVVSNQAGVGKGIYSQKTLAKITENMLSRIKKAGGKIRQVYYCTHRKEANCPCRKPRTGLLKLAKKEYGINLKKAYFIGDTMRDIKTAKMAGCKSILLLCGREKKANQANWKIQPDFVFPDLWAAAQFILKQKP